MSAPKKKRTSRNVAPAAGEAFRRWFGDSKVVGEHGEPLVVYHGGKSSGVRVFRPRTGVKTGSGQAILGEGIYFSTRPEEAQRYAREHSSGEPVIGGAVYSVYLRIEHPYVRGESRFGDAARHIAVDFMSMMHGADYAKHKWAEISRRPNSLGDDVLPPAVLTQMFLADGYDGVIDGHIICVFDSKRIKSATDNVGSYDPGDHDITKNPALVPNAADKRLLHVIKTYWKKYPQAVIDTATIASHLIGTDSTAPSPLDDSDWEVRYKNHTKTGRTDVAGDISVNLISWSLVESLANAGFFPSIRNEVPPWPLSGPSEEMEELLVLNVDERREWDLLRLVRFIGKRLHSHHEYDSSIPWVARELVAAWKAAQVPPSTTHLRFGDAMYPPSYLPIIESLQAKATAIARWAKETRTDINKVSLAQALEAISKYRFKTALGPQGVVAYRFADGWTVQDLREKKELEAEGKNLVHCVGGYCNEVVRGGSRIYSLRDPSGRAYVTLEWQPESVEQRGFWRGDPEDVGASERARNRWQDYISMDAEKFNGDGMTAQAYRTHGHFQQAYGQKNCPVSDDSCQAWLTALADEGEEPVYVEGLRRRLREFIIAKFDGDPESLTLIGIPGKEIDWTGKPLPYYIHALDLSGVDLTKVGHIKANTHFGKANETNFTGLDLAAANFIDASVVGAKFVGASLPDARFIRAMCVHADFTNADLRGADFTNADVSGAKFDGALVDQRTLLRGARGLDLDWQKRHLHLLMRPNQNRRTSRRRR